MCLGSNARHEMLNYSENSSLDWHLPLVIANVICAKRSSLPTWGANLQTDIEREYFFLTTIVTIPINMEYDTWFAVIDLHHQSDSEPLSLYDHLTRQSWFLRIKVVTKSKCLLVTNKTNAGCQSMDRHKSGVVDLQIYPTRHRPTVLSPPEMPR